MPQRINPPPPPRRSLKASRLREAPQQPGSPLLAGLRAQGAESCLIYNNILCYYVIISLYYYHYYIIILFYYGVAVSLGVVFGGNLRGSQKGFVEGLGVSRVCRMSE